MALSLPADLYQSRAVASVSGMSGTAAGLGTIGATYLIGIVADRFSFTPDPPRLQRHPARRRGRRPPARPQHQRLGTRARQSHMSRPRVLVLSGEALFRSFFDRPRERRLRRGFAWARSGDRRVTPRLRRLLADADALVTTWDSPRFGEELLSLAPAASARGPLRRRGEDAFHAAALRAAGHRQRARAHGPLRGRAGGHLPPDGGAAGGRLPGGPPAPVEPGVRAPAPRGRRPRDAPWADGRPARLRTNRAGNGAAVAAVRSPAPRPRPARFRPRRARTRRHAGPARPPPARIGVPRPCGRPHRRDARPSRPRRAPPSAGRRDRRERGPRRDRGHGAPSPPKSARAVSGAPST